MTENLYTWFVKQSPSTGSSSEGAPLWTRLSRIDQKSLESALLAVEVGLGDVANVPVDGGRCEVQIEDRCYVDLYGAVPPPPPRPMRRVLWMRHAGGIDGTWQPYSEQFDEAIEFAYNLLVESAGQSIEAKVQVSHFEREVPLNDGLGSVVHLEFNLVTDDTGTPQWNMLAEERQTGTHSPRPAGNSWLQAFNPQSASVKRTPVKRGGGEGLVSGGYAEPEELLGQEISRLVICVHGVASEEVSHDAGNCLRRNLHRSQLQALGIEEDMEGKWGPEDKLLSVQDQPKMEVMEVFWDQNTTEMKTRNSSLNERLEHMSLQSMPRVRDLLNQATRAAILYSRHRQEILTAVKNSVEAALWRFYAHHPNFAGEVVLVGHSLGGMALFELLLQAELSCEVCALFTLGCPIGLLLESDDAQPLEESRFPGGARFFNVFHPLDPVACRTELLLMPEIGEKPPAKVPTERCPEEGLADKGLQHVQALLGRFSPDRKKNDIKDNSSDCGSVTGSVPGSVVSSAKDSTAGTNERFARLIELIELRLHGRLDWALQIESEIVTGSDSGDVLDTACASHCSYLQNFDLAAFLHASCIQLLQPPEPDRPPPEKVVDIFGRKVAKVGVEAGQGFSSFWEKATKSQAADNLRKFGDSAKDSYNTSGAADMVKGTGQAVTGIFGTARAVYGAAKLVSTGVKGVASVIPKNS